MCARRSAGIVLPKGPAAGGNEGYRKVRAELLVRTLSSKPPTVTIVTLLAVVGKAEAGVGKSPECRTVDERSGDSEGYKNQGVENGF